MERKLPEPGFWRAVLLVLLAFGVQLALAVPLGILDVLCERVLHRPSPELERQPLIIGCINLVAIGVPIALGLHLNRLSFRRAFPFGRVTVQQVAGVALMVLGVGILLSEVDNVFRALLPPPQWLLKAFKDVFFSQDKLLSRILLLVIVAPATEELLFRGIILRGLLSRHPPATALALTSLLFGLLHANPWQFVSAFALGIVIGWVYLRAGSVGLCVLAHALANGLSIVATLIPWNIPGMTGTPDATVVEFQPWWLDVSGLGVLLGGVWVFRLATPCEEEALPPPIPPVIKDYP